MSCYHSFSFAFPISVYGTTVCLLSSPSQKSGSQLWLIPHLHYPQAAVPQVLSLYLFTSWRLCQSVPFFCLGYSNGLLTALPTATFFTFQSRLDTSLWQDALSANPIMWFPGSGVLEGPPMPTRSSSKLLGRECKALHIWLLLHSLSLHHFPTRPSLLWP